MRCSRFSRLKRPDLSTILKFSDRSGEPKDCEMRIRTSSFHRHWRNRSILLPVLIANFIFKCSSFMWSGDASQMNESAYHRWLLRNAAPDAFKVSPRWLGGRITSLLARSGLRAFSSRPMRSMAAGHRPAQGASRIKALKACVGPCSKTKSRGIKWSAAVKIVATSVGREIPRWLKRAGFCPRMANATGNLTKPASPPARKVFGRFLELKKEVFMAALMFGAGG